MDTKTLLHEVGITRLSETVAVIGAFQLPTSLDEALDYLGLFGSIFTFLSLYEAYFPEEYARSTAAILPEEGEPYSEREREFLRLVDARLFPLPLDYLLSVCAAEEREQSIPVMPYGVDWWNESFEDLPLGWQLLLWLCGEVTTETLRQTLPAIDEELFSFSIREGKIQHETLQRRCSELGGPLAHLPLALLMLYHDTDCAFLDVTDDAPCEMLDWCKEHMDLLAEHHRRGMEIDASVASLMQWIEADPARHFREVIEIWNTCTTKQL